MRKVIAACEVCKVFARPRSQPKVSPPMARAFNQVVAMDLMFFGSVPVLKMIDVHTRFLRAARMENKSARELVRVVFREWVSVFGSPTEAYHTDPGSENTAQITREFAEAFGTQFRFTPAKSPQSNGL